MKNQVKITLKYDDGKIKRTLFIDEKEFEDFLERDYQRRLMEAQPEEREKVKKMTPKEYERELNRESYNNWHKHIRHASGDVKNPHEQEDGLKVINPIELEQDNTTLINIEENIEYEALHKKLYKCLSKSQADLFWEVVMENKSVEEIAQRENVTPRAIYLRLETAKKKLRQFF